MYVYIHTYVSGPEKTPWHIKNHRKHRIISVFEGTSGGYLVQPPVIGGPTSVRSLLKPRFTWVFSISKDGDSATSLDHLLQCLTIFTVKIFFLSVVRISPDAVCVCYLTSFFCAHCEDSGSIFFIAFHETVKTPTRPSWASSSPDWTNLGLSASPHALSDPACQTSWWFATGLTPVCQHLREHKSRRVHSSIKIAPPA